MRITESLLRGTDIAYITMWAVDQAKDSDEIFGNNTGKGRFEGDKKQEYQGLVREAVDSVDYRVGRGFSSV